MELPQTGQHTASFEQNEFDKVGAMAHAIEAQLGVNSETLFGNDSTELTYDQAMAGQAVNKKLGVTQELSSVIVAGDEMFGIVRATTPEGAADLLVRFKGSGDDGRPQIVTAITNEARVVGRNAIEGGGSGLSRSHFEIVKDESGAIKVTDLDSTNHTQVLTAEANRPIPSSAEKTATSGLKKFFGKSKAEGKQRPENPLEDFTVWAAKSQTVLDYLKPQDRFFVVEDVYEAPADQIAAEFALMDRFKQQFPEQEVALTESLNEVKRFAGIGVPKYKLEGPIKGSTDDSPTDENGYLATGEHFFAALQLQMPLKELSALEFSALSSDQQADYMMGREGVVVVGDVPTHTRALLEGLYQLTGARAVRNDLADGSEKNGTLIRQGTYQGSTVYFKERYSTYKQHSYIQNQPDTAERRVLRVDMINEKSALEAIHNDLRPHEERELFMNLPEGVSRIDIRSMVTRGDITRHNYQNIAELIRAIPRK